MHFRDSHNQEGHDLPIDTIIQVSPTSITKHSCRNDCCCDEDVDEDDDDDINVGVSQ